LSVADATLTPITDGERRPARLEAARILGRRVGGGELEPSGEDGTGHDTGGTHGAADRGTDL
jgi:hypothetical protein